MQGNFIPSKQMIFDADKILAPFEAVKKVNDNHSPFQRHPAKRNIEVKQKVYEPKVNLEAIGHKAMNVEKQ
jgi:hypothetical protein